ncbi:AMP-binding protein [Robertkochia aurantiaca]|uniref:AMP-binding protein n=1 Tax=Robertkochia aurantiaca TaxID=2873700 RepID=UPI001CCD6252|nr:AMP-binding protein [Robertkochia sp. 3YJGBD-33]
MSGIHHILYKKDSITLVNAESGTKHLLTELLLEGEITDALPFRSGLAFLYINNSLDDVIAYLSLLNTGLTLALLKNDLEASLKTDLESKYRPNLIFDPKRNKIPNTKQLAITNHEIGLSFFIYDRGSTGKIDPRIKVLLSTSGTTGSPKFVKLSGENLWANADSIASYLPIERSDTVPLNLPLNYSYGLSVLHSNLLKGCTLVTNVPDIISPEFWTGFNKYGYSTLAGVPFVYELLDRIGFRNKDLPSLRYFTQAGGNLSEPLKRAFYTYSKEKDKEFYIMYGQTEASARISYVPYDQLPAKINSIGTPVKNGKLYIDSENHELLYEGPNIFGGYATSMEDLKSYKNIPVLRTGDIARQDEEGFFYIVGRLKRFVKLFGNRINLDELERFLKEECPGASLACDNIEDKFILVSIVGDPMAFQNVKQSLFEKFKIHPSSVKLQFVKEMPLTKNGKTDYQALSVMYADDSQP